MTYWRRRPRRTGQQAKMGNQISLVCEYGFSHRSKLESAVCQLIRLREKAGELEHLQHECHVYLTEARIGYIPDFKCRDTKTGEEFYVEAKGYANDRWPIKKKLWKFYGPGRLEIFTGTHLNPVLSEEIIPKRRDDGQNR